MQTVNQATLGVTVSAAASAVYGTIPQAYTATVTVVDPTAPAPIGTMTFSATGPGGTTTLGTATNHFTPLGNGVYQTSVNFNGALNVGTYRISAAFSGDPSYANITSSPVQQVVTQATPRIAVTAIVPNPSVTGQAKLGYTATLSTPFAGAAPTGTLMFAAVDGNGNRFYRGAVRNYSGGSGFFTATVSTSTLLNAGTYNVTATHAPDATSNYAAATSNVFSQLVQQAQTTTTLVADATPIPFGAAGSVIATVGVVSPGGGTPTGQVVFFIMGTSVSTQTVNLTSPTASPDLTSLLPGNYSIQAQYLGDSNYFLSGSALVAITISPAVTTAAIASITANPSTVGSQVTFVLQIAVSPTSAAIVFPTGTVEFTTTAGGPTIDLGSTPDLDFFGIDPASGLAIFQATVISTAAPSLTAGRYQINATYTGDTTYQAPASIAPATLKINQGTPELRLQFTSPVPLGDLPQAYTAVVTAPAPTSPAPTGTIALSVDGARVTTTNSTYTPLGNGQYQMTLSYGGPALTITGSPHAILATMAADTNYTSVASRVGSIQQVTLASVAIALPTATPNPSNVGHSVTYFVTLTTVAAGRPDATGSVVFTARRTNTGATIPLGSAPITGSGNSYTATLTGAAPLPAGIFDLAATYSGDTNYATNSATSFAAETVNPVTPTLAFDPTTPVSPNPQPFARFPVTYNLVLTGPMGGPTPTGTLTASTLVNGTMTTLGISTTFVSRGGGQFSVAVLSNSPALDPTGSPYAITVAYSGDSFLASANITTQQTVIAAPVLSVAYTNRPTTLTPGTSAVFNIQVSNTGQADETTAFVTQTLPAGTTFVSSLSSAGWNQVSPGMFQLPLSTVPVGGSVNVHFAVSTPTNVSAGTAFAAASVFDSLSAGVLASVTQNLTILGSSQRWPTF